MSPFLTLKTHNHCANVLNRQQGCYLEGSEMSHCGFVSLRIRKTANRRLKKPSKTWLSHLKQAAQLPTPRPCKMNSLNPSAVGSQATLWKLQNSRLLTKEASSWRCVSLNCLAELPLAQGSPGNSLEFGKHTLPPPPPIPGRSVRIGGLAYVFKHYTRAVILEQRRAVQLFVFVFLFLLFQGEVAYLVESRSFEVWIDMSSDPGTAAF